MPGLHQRASFVGWCVKPLSWWRTLFSPISPLRKHTLSVWVRTMTLIHLLEGESIFHQDAHSRIIFPEVWRRWTPPRIASYVHALLCLKPNITTVTEKAQGSALVGRALNNCVFKDRTLNEVSNTPTLKHFHWFLELHHVLVRMDNTAMVTRKVVLPPVTQGGTQTDDMEWYAYSLICYLMAITLGRRANFI